MITQWDIVSRIEPSNASICYSLLIDGTEHDARLITKKLEGYVQHTQAAESPYVYRFDLPADLDDTTLDKIRVAVQEGIEQAKKVNEFVPGGALGNPLFNAEVTKEDKNFPTFITLDPSESFFQKEPAPSLSKTDVLKSKSIDLDGASAEKIDPAPTSNDLEEALQTDEPAIEKATYAAEPEELPDTPGKTVSSALPVEEDKNVSFLSKTQPLNDIFLAETKYDIFVDMDTKRNKRPAASADSSSELPAEETDGGFNVFDQKIKDQTAFLDLSDVSSVTTSITEKDLSFLKHTQPGAPEQSQDEQQTEVPLPQTAKQNQQNGSGSEQEESSQVMDPFEQLLASAQDTPQEAPAENNSLTSAQETPLPEVGVRLVSTDTAATPATGQPPSTEESAPSPSKEGPSIPPEHVSAPVAEKSISSIPLASITENNMTTDNQGEKTNTFFLKRKEKSPTPPKPAAPVSPAPAAPKPPMPAAPAKPAAPTIPQAPQPAAPQEEVHRTVVRKIPASTFLEKTRTIDHSIELPLSELQRHNWPLEVPLIPTYTLENMIISVNRFAHATAISVIENPGKLYNPLVLYGASGTGKTHFLHAIGYALSKKYGQENVFVTNGVRLSRGIQRYIIEGKIDKFTSFASSLKALLIDDIHLISINEQNRAHLSKLLNDFRNQQKQIVITSKYPPENLAKLEELLDFKLDSGWISELKSATGNARMRIIQHMLTGNGINITNNDVERFFGHANMSLGTVVRSIRRVRVLEKMVFPNMPSSKRSALAIFDQLLATKGEDQTSQIYQKSISEVQNTTVTGNGEWGRIGFFYPQNHSDMMNWMLFAMQQRAKELGIEGGLELAVRSSYSTENIISSAFKIANLCDNKKLKGAVILGPSLDTCEPSIRENFYDILTHMLEIMLIRCGVINMEDASAPSTYVKILAELLR